MPDIDDESQDADVPAMAIQGLIAAQERAVAAGYPIVLVRNGQLVRIVDGQTTVLKSVLPREKVTARTKIAK